VLFQNEFLCSNRSFVIAFVSKSPACPNHANVWLTRLLNWVLRSTAILLKGTSLQQQYKKTLQPPTTIKHSYESPVMDYIWHRRREVKYHLERKKGNIYLCRAAASWALYSGPPRFWDQSSSSNFAANVFLPSISVFATSNYGAILVEIFPSKIRGLIGQRWST
jgi:hypothetical protein